MYHTAVRRAALTSFAVNVFCLLSLLLVASVLRPYRIPASANQNPPADHVENIEAQPVQLPMKIDCTSLEVRTMAIYDGPFYEDGSGTEVADVAALIVYNDSDRLIPYANILLDTENGTLVFLGYMLPPRSATLIPEASARQYAPGDIYNIYGWHTEEQEGIRSAISITEQDDITLQIENCSGKDLNDLTVYFKKYLNSTYIGGKPYEFKVPLLPADESITVSPRYYVSGYSRVVYHKEEQKNPPGQP